MKKGLPFFLVFGIRQKQFNLPTRKLTKIKHGRYNIYAFLCIPTYLHYVARFVAMQSKPLSTHLYTISLFFGKIPYQNVPNDKHGRHSDTQHQNASAYFHQAILRIATRSIDLAKRFLPFLKKSHQMPNRTQNLRTWCHTLPQCNAFR